MRVLIACEFSGVVRRAFRERGHDAFSCDLLPAEDGGEYHIQGDARELLNVKAAWWQAWDLLIAHPPCTYLCNSGVRWLWIDGPAQYVEMCGRTQRMHAKVFDPKRNQQMREACELFAHLYHAPITRVCIENPVMHRYARENLRALHVPEFSQTVQPWQFGHGEIKRTCLWLRGLPALVPTKIVEGRAPRVHHASPSADRWKERSRTLAGIANAMAEQWGSL